MKWWRLVVLLVLVGSLLYLFEQGLLSGKVTESQGRITQVLEEASQDQTDIYAWIRVEGTRIDYPILQHPSDDSYYLSHDQNGEETYYGAIFTELVNRKTFDDPVTLIYGHAMQDGAMFGTLDYFEDQTFAEEQGAIRIQTLDEVLDYEVLAAHPYGDDHLVDQFDLTNPEGVKDYVMSLEERAHAYGGWYRSLDLDPGQDQLLILSTCDAITDNQRYVVTARLKSRQERS